MTKDTIKLQKFLIPVFGHLYPKSYIKSEKEDKVFSIDYMFGPDLKLPKPMIEIRYKNSPEKEFPKYNMADQIFKEIHMHGKTDVYEFDARNYRIEFPDNGNGGMCNTDKNYNRLTLNIFYNKSKTVNEYSPRDMKRMFKSKIEIPIEKKK